MSYRPPIPKNVHKRIEKRNLGEATNLNEEYIDAIKFMYDEDGEYNEWLDRVNKFGDRNDLTKEEAVKLLICTVLDDSGHIEETFRKPRLFENNLW